MSGYKFIEEMSIIADANHYQYNKEKSHQGRNMYGRTPYQAFIDGIKNDDANFISAAYFFPREKCQENTIIVYL